MTTPLLSDFLETLVTELAAENGPVNQACRTAYNRSPLIVRGSWFGEDRVLTEQHAPFIAVYPTETPAEVEIHRDADPGAAPRTFELSIAVGIALDEPVEPPPVIDPTNPAPVVYAAGGEAVAERFAYQVLSAATARFSACGYTAQSATLDYSASQSWPLVVYDFTLSFAVSQRLATGIL